LIVLGLQRAQMISIKGGSELLVYGGHVGGAPLDDIWKYEVAKDSWTQFGKMLTARADHVTIAVSGVVCP
jgi:hypothetical protein